MKIGYFDCFSGASGDMILGALVDAGLDFDLLRAEIGRLGLNEYCLSKKAVRKRGLGGVQVVVEVDHDTHGHHHRHLSDIEAIIDDSGLAPEIKRKSRLVFRRLAEAEAKVHGTSVKEVHFHEVGAVDTIVDVVGAVIGFSALGIERIYCSAIHLGTGTVECAHGTLPVPAPATAELVKGCPVYSTGVEGELLTPTGAAILTSFAAGFGTMPKMKVEKIGYGAGTSELPIANLLRLMIGHSSDRATGYESEQVAVIETSIDDMNPQVYEFLIEKLLTAGVMDVFFSSLQMKKSRPGTLVTVICAPESVHQVSDTIMKETTSIGVRWRIDNRIKAQREMASVSTSYGKIRIKICRAGQDIVNIAPEYEDCKQRALEYGVPLQTVMAAAQQAISERF